MGVLPLGTGNDLARVLGWGAVFDDDTQLPTVLEKMEHAQIKMLDRWSILAYEASMPPPRKVSQQVGQHHLQGGGGSMPPPRKVSQQVGQHHLQGGGGGGSMPPPRKVSQQVGQHHLQGGGGSMPPPRKVSQQVGQHPSRGGGGPPCPSPAKSPSR